MELFGVVHAIHAERLLSADMTVLLPSVSVLNMKSKESAELRGEKPMQRYNVYIILSLSSA